MSTIASLIVEIGADLAGLRRGLDDASGLIEGAGSRLQSAGSTITGLGGQISLLTTPLLGIGAAGIAAASGFENVMTQLATFGGLAGDELAAVEAAALRMGAETMFSASDAAGAMLELVKAGQSVDEAMVSTEAALALAAVGAMSVTEAAGVTAMAMAQFGLDADAAGRITEALAAAASASQADVRDLAQGMGNVGPVAKQFGLSVEETAAVLGVFSNAGIQGAEAGTQLRSMLLNMTRTTEATQGAWARLGTSMYDANGELRDLDTVFDEIGTAMADMPVEEQNAIMSDLFGSYGIVGAQALIAAGGIDAMQAAMADAPPAAFLAAEAMNTFSGRVDSLKGSVETLLIKAMTPFMNDVLSPLVTMLTDVANKAIAWTDANPELTSTLVKVGGALLILGPALVAVGLGVSAVGIAFTGLGAGIALLTSPLVLAAVGLLAVGAGVAYLWTQDIGGIRTAFSDLGDTLGGLNLNPVKDALRGVGDALGTIDVTGGVDTFRTSVESAFAGMDTAGAADAVKTNLELIVSTGLALFGMVMGGPVGLAIGAAKLVATAIETDFLGIGTFLKESGILPAVESAARTLWDDVQRVVGDVFGGGGMDGSAMLGLVDGTADAVSAAPNLSAFSTFVNDLKAGADALISLVNDVVANNLAPGLTALGGGIKGFVDNLAGTDTEGLDDLIAPVLSVVGGLASVAVKLVGIGFEGIASAVGGALPGLGTAISGFISALSNLGEGDFADVFSSLGTGLQGFANALLAIPVGFANTVITELAALTGLQLPDVAGGLQAWADALGMAGLAIAIVFDTLKRDLSMFFLDVQLAVIGHLGTFRQAILDATGGTIDIAPSLSMDTYAIASQLETLQLGDEVTRVLNEQLAAGTVDLGAGVQLETANSSISTALGNLLRDPALVDSMSVAGRESIQNALNLAVQTGDAATFAALVPVAADLDIPLQELVTQLDTAVTDAAMAQVYSAALTVNLTLLPGTIDDGAVTGAIANSTQAATISRSARPGARAIGGAVLANTPYLVGERGAELFVPSSSGSIVPNGALGGGNVTVHVTAYGSAPHELLDMIQRAARESGR